MSDLAKQICKLNATKSGLAATHVIVRTSGACKPQSEMEALAWVGVLGLMSAYSSHRCRPDGGALPALHFIKQTREETKGKARKSREKSVSVKVRKVRK